jgi:peroxiredoxin
MTQRLDKDHIAPDFELVDTRDQKVRISDFRGKKFVVLVLNRGFM